MFCVLRVWILCALVLRNFDWKIWSPFCHLKLQDLFTVISRGYFAKLSKKRRCIAYELSNLIGGKYYVGCILSVDYDFCRIFG